jgi:hypothetical protein
VVDSATPRDRVIETIRRHIDHRWIASERSTGDFVGWFGLVPIAAAQYAVGYRLERQAWSKGR